MLWVVGLWMGCTPTPVALTPEGERVAVLATLADAEQCKELGTVHAAASSAMSNEDTRLLNARNRAGALGGNRILLGRIEITGVQEFRVFRCP